MRLGIDFGTTHTVVAVVDRGNYPVVSFDGVDAWPSIIAANEGGELRYGPDAAAVRHDPHWSVLRSFKRLLNDAGPTTTVELAGRRYLLADLFAGSDIRYDLGDEITFKPGGIIQTRAADVLTATRELLEEIAEIGFFGAIERGVFGDAERKIDEGRGAEGVIDMDETYFNPCVELMEGARVG